MPNTVATDQRHHTVSISEADYSALNEDSDQVKGKHFPRLDATASMMKNMIYFVVFLLAGPTLIMVNKQILRDLNFHYPLFLSFFTLGFCSSVCAVVVHVFKIPLPHREHVTTRFFLQNVMPIGALSAGTIVLGMSSYLFLTVSFVQMLKAFTPVMTMAGLVLFRLEYPSRKVVACVLVISLGTAIAGFGEINFSLVGVCTMLFAQFCEAMKLVYTQKILQSFRFNVFETLYFVTPVSAVWVLCAAMVLEYPYMDDASWGIFTSNWTTFLFAGVCALLTNGINSVVIQITSALTLKLVATSRNACLVLFNAFVLHETVTPLQFLGYSVSLSAFMAYNYVKSQAYRQGIK